MKSKVLLVLLFGLSSFAHSQNKKFSLSTNLLNLAVSGPSVSLSYRCSPKLAFQIYGSSGNFDRFLSHSRYQFKTTILDVKYSFTQDFYIGPYLRYIDKKVQREGFLDNTGFVAIGDRDFHGQGIASDYL